MVWLARYIPLMMAIITFITYLPDHFLVRYRINSRNVLRLPFSGPPTWLVHADVIFGGFPFFLPETSVEKTGPHG